MTSDLGQGRYNALSVQNVVGIGTDVHLEMLRRALQPLNFVTLKTAKSAKEVDYNAQFLVVVADYAAPASVQALARFVTSLPTFSGTKIFYVINPPQISNEELLFGVELDAKRTFFGPKRDEDIKAFIKQRALETTEVGNLAHVEAEVRKAIHRHDATTVTLWIDKLIQMDKTSEDVNRILALLAEERRDYKRYVFYLKQTLVANPENLWAANRLGTYYLNNRQVAEGISILKRMSRFHELNAERMLVLGDALLNVGLPGEAERPLQRGDQLTGGVDERFAEGLAKIDVMKGNPSQALERLGRKHLSNAVISFLNTRAVLSIRSKSFEEGGKLYKQALAGCDPRNGLVLAKVYFNQGLAFVRNDQPELAVVSFQKSLEKGGSSFNRAAKPLAVAKQIVLTRERLKASGGNCSEVLSSSQQALDDFDFEIVR
ncbi:MAG: hypothetical protein NTV34_19965 [Proteobacteria bacterium]|nr:hypothetical protein [Pseudomonadota bacterium]